jgi:hypothetical protein
MEYAVLFVGTATLAVILTKEQKRETFTYSNSTHLQYLIFKLRRIKDCIEDDEVRQRFKQKLNDRSVSFNVCSDGSFTVDKENVNICMIDKKSKKRYSDNALIYVLLHEIAHVISKSSHHTAEWEYIFNQLLTAASQCKVYDSTLPFPQNYCK